MLDEFSEELADLDFGVFEGLASQGGGSIDFSERFAVALFAGAKITFPFQAVEHGVEGSGADAIAVALQLLGHSQTEDGAFDGMVQDVEADQARV